MRRLVLIIALFIVPAIAATTPSVNDVVAANYPSELAQFVARHGLQDARQQTYVQLSVDGVDCLVAAYSTGGTTGTGIGALVLLERTAGTYRVADKVRQPLVGVDPHLRAIDLDGDGRLEIVLDFDLGKGGSQTWIYRVADHHFVMIGPMDGPRSSPLLIPDIVDLDGNGKLDLLQDLNYGTRQEPKIVHAHFALRGGTYVALEPLDYYATFARGKTKPVTASDTFTVPSNMLAKPFHLVVLNGKDYGRSARVGSGSITINGVLVSGPNDFSENRGVWSVPIALTQQNTITVTLGGKPGGCVAVAIRHDQ